MKPIIENAKLSERGQVVVPKAIREALGARPDDTLQFYAAGDGTVLVRREDRERLAETFRSIRASVKKEDQMSDEDVVKLIHQIRAENRRPGHQRADFGADLAEWERRTGVAFSTKRSDTAAHK